MKMTVRMLKAKNVWNIKIKITLFMHASISIHKQTKYTILYSQRRSKVLQKYANQENFLGSKGRLKFVENG